MQKNRACLKASHSSGNVEMVKEIGMRVGGPSESQVRGMRSEREIRERGQGTDSTHIQQVGGKKMKISDRMRNGEETRELGLVETRKRSEKTRLRSVNQIRGRMKCHRSANICPAHNPSFREAEIPQRLNVEH